ncbi:hypothetical protein KSU02_08905 [Fusobacterium nucleatum]|uniref:hypothetical protein n=1 Tax=Fusobacterium nucleatum TaxID=851 RepID=UPI0030CC43D3
MEKENVLEIEITKINNEYSLAIVKKMNRKVIEEKKKYKFGYGNSSNLETNSKLHKDPNFSTYISDTILCFDLYLNSENDCFTIKNNLVESLELFLQEFNEKYGIPKRWRAEKYKEYCFLNSYGYIISCFDFYEESDNKNYELGNYFKTREEAQKVIDSKEYQNFWAKVRAGEIGGDD